MSIRRVRGPVLAVTIAGSLILGACVAADSAPDRSTPESVTVLPVNEPLAQPAPNVYTVVRGDTMARIARAHDVSLAELVAVNDVPNPELIEPGLELFIPPLPEPVVAPAPAVIVTTASEPIAPPPPVDEAWYQPLVDRLPALPAELEPVQPVLVAVGVILVVLMGVGVIALSLQLVYALLGAGASGLAGGGRGLQAAFAGIPGASGAGGSTRRLVARPFGWRPQLHISRLSLPITRPRFRGSSGSTPALAASDAAPADAAPVDAAPVDAAAASPVAAPEAPPAFVTPRPPVEETPPAPLTAPPLAPAAAPGLPSAPGSVPPAAHAPAPALAGVPASSLPYTPSRQPVSLQSPTPPPSAALPLATPEESTRPGRLARFWRGFTARVSAVAAAIGRALVIAASHTRSATVAAARAIGRWTRAAAIATWRATLRFMRYVAAVPGRFLHEHGDQRRRKQFREQVESSTAARMRLGLRDDSETYLQESLDASLAEGWQLEAAWCLQLLAEEADRRGDRALAELRRVRARELIRDHAIEEGAPA